MLHKTNTKPYKIIAAIFIVVSVISIFFQVNNGDHNYLFTLAMLLSAIGSISWIYAVKKKAYEAARIYEENLNKFPDESSLLYNCAIAGLISGDKIFALEKLADFLKKYPQSLLVDKANRLNESLRENKKLKNEEICYAAEELRRQGKLAEAELEFKRELSINHKADWAYYGLVLVYIQLGNIELAEESFKKFKGFAFNERDIRVSNARRLIKLLRDNQAVDVDEFIFRSLRRSRRFLYWWVGFMGFMLLLFVYFTVLQKIIR